MNRQRNVPYQLEFDKMCDDDKKARLLSRLCVELKAKFDDYIRWQNTVDKNHEYEPSGKMTQSIKKSRELD